MTIITEMFTQLPIATNANMTDIIAAVQGYVSPSVLGSLNQATLQKVFNLFLANTILNNPGNPNGVLAGNTYQLCWDTTDSNLYVCSVSGTASTAKWSLVTENTPSNLTWNTVNAVSQAMLTNNGYVINYALGSVALSLPLVSAVGDELIIMGFSASGYSIAQATGQQIIIAPNTTTLGVGGSLSTTNRYNAITLRCLIADTIWGVSSGPQDVFTIV